MGLGIKRRLVAALDRPGGRDLLAGSINAIGRIKGFRGIRVFFENGRWFHQVNNLTFPGRPKFAHWPYRFADFQNQEARYLSDAKDYWMAFYTPSFGDVVVDIGAGEGEDVLAFSRGVGPKGRVLAIEAFPATYEVLSYFCARNGLTNTVALHFAVSESAGSRTFRESLHWVENAIDDESEGGVAVRGAILSQICLEQGIDSIDYLKMNIEGAEVQALKGMTGMLRRIKAICVSCHDFRADRGDGEQFRTRRFVVDFLQMHGFELRFRDDPRPYVRDQVFGTHRAA